jgi:hypothetical protein
MSSGDINSFQESEKSRCWQDMLTLYSSHFLSFLKKISAEFFIEGLCLETIPNYFFWLTTLYFS